MSTATPPRPTPARSAVPPRPRPAKVTTNIDPIRVVRRHLVLLGFSAIVGLGLGIGAFILLNKKMPSYSGEVLFEIQSGLRESSDFGTDISQMNDDTVSRIAETESLILRSRPVIEAAVEDPDIKETTWYQGWKDVNGIFQKDKAVDQLIKETSAGLLRGTNLFQISWSAREAKDVPVVLNAIANTYRAQSKRNEEARFNLNRDPIERRLERTERDMADLDVEIRGLIAEKGITDVNDTFRTQDSRIVEALGRRMADIETTLSYNQSQLEQVMRKLQGVLEPSDDDLAAAEINPLVLQVERSIVDLEIEIKAALEKYPSDHHVVERLESRLRAAKRQKREKVDEIVRRNLESSLTELQARVEQDSRALEQLQGTIDENEGRLQQLAADLTELDQLMRQREQYEAARDRDRELVKEIELLKLRADASRVNLRRPALEPREKAFPKPLVIVPLGMVICFGATLALVFLREFTDQRVKGPSDLEILPHATVLGVLPERGEDPTRAKSAELVVKHHPTSVLAESYRQTATPILRMLDLTGHQSIVFAGGLPGAGTTTVITNLATSFAASGRRVLVVDANFRRPRMASCLGLDSAMPGLGDALVSDLPLESVVQRADAGFDAVTAGSAEHRVVERLSTEPMDRLLASARDRYDVVLIDTPPAVVAGDAIILANKVDAAVLVVRAYQEQKGLVARLVNQFYGSRCDLLGIVLNRPRGTVGGYFRKNFQVMAKYGQSGRARGGRSKSGRSKGAAG